VVTLGPRPTIIGGIKLHPRHLSLLNMQMSMRVPSVCFIYHPTDPPPLLGSTHSFTSSGCHRSILIGNEIASDADKHYSNSTSPVQRFVPCVRSLPPVRSEQWRNGVGFSKSLPSKPRVQWHRWFSSTPRQPLRFIDDGLIPFMVDPQSVSLTGIPIPVLL